MTLYLEQFVESLRDLPTELARNLTQLRELDSACQLKSLDMEGKMKRLVKSWRAINRDQKSKQYDLIKGEFESARQLAEKKVALAASNYEMVDRHIRRLDADSIRFQADLQRRMIAATSVESEEETMPKRKSTGTQRVDKKNKMTTMPKEDNNKNKKKNKKRKLDDSASSCDLILPGGAAAASAALLQRFSTSAGAHVDMPIDPNEPTYCICHQVSYGEMVGCDNAECPIEWFHFQCVGLDSKPKGKWYCPRCTELRRTKKGTH